MIFNGFFNCVHRKEIVVKFNVKSIINDFKDLIFLKKIGFHFDKWLSENVLKKIIFFIHIDIEFSLKKYWYWDKQLGPLVHL